MAPHNTGGEGTLKGFDAKETLLLAAAFVASLDGKLDYKVLSAVTGNTVGTLQNKVPALKRRAQELNTSSGGGGGGDGTPAKPKANAPKKRKAAEDEDEAQDGVATDENGKTKKGRGKGGRRAKKAKGSEDDEAAVNEELDQEI